MKQTIFKYILTLMIGLLWASSVNAQDDQLVVIGNPESVPSELDLQQLRSILKGEKLRWNDGSQVVIALMKTNTTIGNHTSKRLYNMTGNELNKYFLALVFQGKVKAPTFFNSTDELATYVSQTPGAIGVLQNPNEKVLKIILVDGKKQI